MKPYGHMAAFGQKWVKKFYPQLLANHAPLLLFFINIF